jgi:flagellar protein FlaJ
MYIFIKVGEMKMKKRTLPLIFVFIGAGLFVLNVFMFGGNAVLNIVSAAIALGMPLFISYQNFTKLKAMERMFPVFLRNITQNIKTGMTLTQAIRTASDMNYGLLTRYVKELNAKISWGVSFANALNEFAKKTKSPIIKRTVKSIIEVHESGGKIDTVLEAISISVQEVEAIKQKRSMRVYSQMVSGYFIYVIFLGVMFALTHFLIPTFQIEGGLTADVFSEMFRNLVIIQGVFAGLAIGKMAEGTLIGGVKHSFVLIVLGYTVFAFV